MELDRVFAVRTNWLLVLQKPLLSVVFPTMLFRSDYRGQSIFSVDSL